MVFVREMADDGGRMKRPAVCCPAEKRHERTKMAALRVVLFEQESKRMKRTKEIEEEVRGVEGDCAEYMCK